MGRRRRDRHARWSRLYADVSRFVREYTDGLSTGEVRRLFDREASTAWEVLAGDDAATGPRHPVGRILHRARVLFVGLSFRLSPARRLLFVASLAAAVTGLFDLTTIHGERLVIDFSPFWFLLAVGGLVFLLMLELVDRIRVRDELEVARSLQRALLPVAVEPIPGYRFAHSYRTAREVGGDYYAVHPLPDGRVVVAVGDASGHGMAAGLIMAIAHSTLLTAIELDPDPESVARVLNAALRRIGGSRSFMTLVYALLEPESGAIEMVSAGHPFPLLRRADGRVEELGSGALPLGLREKLDVDHTRVVLAPGETLVLFSDGLPEATSDPSGESFGFARIGDLVAAGGSPDEIHDRIRRTVDGFTGAGEVADDQTLLVLERSAVAAAVEGAVDEPVAVGA